MFTSCRIYLIPVLLVLVLAQPKALYAESSLYGLEVGFQAGAGYYAGDAASLFMAGSGGSLHHLREVYGVQCRYRFDYRWAMQIKGQRQCVKYSFMDNVYVNPMWNIDATCEFHFFRFGLHPYDPKIKSVTPFLFIGIGMTLCNQGAYLINDVGLISDYKTGLYVPLGIGVKWMFAERWQLQAMWQNQVYVYNGDGIEGMSELNNSYDMNGINIMNNDIVSSFTIGLTFAFWKKNDQCIHCTY